MAKEFSNYFIDSDIDEYATTWKLENKNMWLTFLPLGLHDQPQYCIQRVNDVVTRIDFAFSEIEGQLILNDFFNGNSMVFDTSELRLSKLRLSGKNWALLFQKVLIEKSKFLV